MRANHLLSASWSLSLCNKPECSGNKSGHRAATTFIKPSNKNHAHTQHISPCRGKYMVAQFQTLWLPVKVPGWIESSSCCEIERWWRNLLQLSKKSETMSSASFHWAPHEARGDKCPNRQKYWCSLTCHTTYQNDSEPHVYPSFLGPFTKKQSITLQRKRMCCQDVPMVRCPRTKHLGIDIVERINVGRQKSAVFIRLCMIMVYTILYVLNGTIELNNLNYLCIVLGCLQSCWYQLECIYGGFKKDIRQTITVYT